MREASHRDDAVELRSIDCRIRLDEIHEKVVAA